jgi:predicted RecA/RadA family phage recombinase
MKNFVQNGAHLTTQAPAALSSGDGVILGSIFGIAAETVAIGERVDLTLDGVFDLPKVAALAIAVGDSLYWDSAAKLVTKTAAANKKIGLAFSNAVNPSARVNVRLVQSA